MWHSMPATELRPLGTHRSQPAPSAGDFHCVSSQTASNRAQARSTKTQPWGSSSRHPISPLSQPAT
eukprot:775034-Lingulodinium_polyedra.AAC.1